MLNTVVCFDMAFPTPNTMTSDTFVTIVEMNQLTTARVRDKINGALSELKRLEITARHPSAQVSYHGRAAVRNRCPRWAYPLIICPTEGGPHFKIGGLTEADILSEIAIILYRNLYENKPSFAWPTFGDHYTPQRRGEVETASTLGWTYPITYIRNTPNRVSSIGALSAAESARPSTRRVSCGVMMPSSHSRAVA
jgi:hypothetical protein